MLNREKISFMRICLFVLLALGLFICSCKKKNQEQLKPGEPKTVVTPPEQINTTVEQKLQPSESNKPKMVPLETELPKAMFVGTPVDIRVPNLETPRTGDRPTFYVPEGTKNVASGKEVTASDPEPIIGELEMVTDGDKEAADGCYVEFAPGVQYITIDLGDEYNIYAILVWHYHKQPRVYYDVVVQVAKDADFITAVKTLFNNDIDNSASLGVGKDKHYTETNEGKLIEAGGVQGRYVRLYSNGSNADDMNHYIEVEVFGKPVE